MEWLMRANGWHGVRRQKNVRTTTGDPSAVVTTGSGGPPVRVAYPNTLLVADFTHVNLVTGNFVYVAFVIDAYAGSIVGLEASGSKHTVPSSPGSARPLRYGAARVIRSRTASITAPQDVNI
ncbi:hypothetical protein BST23_13625 [Mycolicibacterium elephantis]|uniref:Integrase catalytic domain-containing protein n=1 Tax=Mycolicibacterium elephantis TaxID=81858 RepID=A0A1X0CZ81_9MYCO|nr:hypothetical protein BST23_13625 [Mycolicibacterium elephantis]